MQLTVILCGREAIPVRAIPYISGWLFLSDSLITSLAGESGVRNEVPLRAYHPGIDGQPVALLPKEWDGITAETKALESSLRKAEASGEMAYEEAYAHWRQQSVKLFPPGVFVWRDEFEDFFAKAFHQDSVTILPERPGDRDLNLSPWVPAELRDILMEGFEPEVCEQALAHTTITSEPAVANSKESPRDRAHRLKVEKEDERKKGTKAYAQAVAERNHISPARMNELIRKFTRD